MDRLDKFLCGSGAGTRSQVKRILKAGRVTVDGAVEKDGSRKIDPDTQAVTLDGEPLSGRRRLVVMLNKPAGFVTATEDARQKTVMELLPKQWAHLNLKPVGRLDKDTEGLLLFTNDGAFANELMHPRHQVDKTYLVWVTGYGPGKEGLLEKPLVLDGYRIRPPVVRLLEAAGQKARLEITIHEGRNRQIRRMCQARGMTVTRLKRIREGTLELGNLGPGAWRYLTAEEVKKILPRDR